MQSEPEQSAIPRKLSLAKVCRNPIGCGLGKKKKKTSNKKNRKKEQHFPDVVTLTL